MRVLISGDFLSVVADQALKTPELAAVEFEGQTLTYSALWRETANLEAQLRRAGLGGGQIAAVCLERSLDLIVAVIATLRAGAGYLPLDPMYPADWLSDVVSKCGATVYITRSEIARRLLPASGGPRVLMDGFRSRGIAETTATPGVSWRYRGTTADAPAYVIYTSGSTGKPKGVVMGRRALANLVQWQRHALPLRPAERVLQFTSLSFDVSFQEIFTTLAEGGTLVLVDDKTRRNPERLWDYMIENRINRLYVPFVALEQLAAVAASSGEPLPPLRDVITAGEQLKCSPSIKKLFQRIPNAKLHNHYGPTETHVVTAYTLPADVDSWPTLPPIGRPLPNVLVRVLNSDLQAVPPGEAGELFLGGVCLAEGYLDNEELTRERFVHLEAGSAGGDERSERLYRTGDQVRVLPDGCLEYLGRLDRQVKIRGHRVELGEIEAALLSHESVLQAAVGTADRAGERVLVAYYVAKENNVLEERQLRPYLSARLPEYMIPSAIVELSSMPMTPSGKIDRLSLPPLDPTHRNEAPGSDYVAPRTELETRIANLWSEVLGRTYISVIDNFFEVGGSSLAIVQLRTLLNDRLHCDLSLAEMFEYPTVAMLAERLNRPVTGPSLAAMRARVARQRGAGPR